MKKFIVAGFAIALLAGVAVSNMQDEAPQGQQWQMPKPQKEHEWLKQLEGEWVSDVKAPGSPEHPGFESKGSETVRSVGGFWIIAENKGDMDGTPFTGILTLGYDTSQKMYVGSWVDSMTSYMWTYEGSVEGNKLTLNTEGPSPMDPTTRIKFREVLEVKDKDHKTFTSSMQGEDGSWTQMMTINYTRKK